MNKKRFYTSPSVRTIEFPTSPLCDDSPDEQTFPTPGSNNDDYRDDRIEEEDLFTRHFHYDWN